MTRPMPKKPLCYATSVNIHIHAQTCTYACTHMHVCMHTHARMHAHTCMYMHTCINTHTHTQTHKHTSAQSLPRAFTSLCIRYNPSFNTAIKSLFKISLCCTLSEITDIQDCRRLACSPCHYICSKPTMLY